MKTAVSIPDELFEKAEQTAKRLKMSRSQLYAEALADFLRQREAASITERLNAVYEEGEPGLDQAIHRAQWKSIGRESW